jgi:hypothetical protein
VGRLTHALRVEVALDDREVIDLILLSFREARSLTDPHPMNRGCPGMTVAGLIVRSVNLVAGHEIDYRIPTGSDPRIPRLSAKTCDGLRPFANGIALAILVLPQRVKASSCGCLRLLRKAGVDGSYYSAEKRRSCINQTAGRLKSNHSVSAQTAGVDSSTGVSHHAGPVRALSVALLPIRRSLPGNVLVMPNCGK